MKIESNKGRIKANVALAEQEIRQDANRFLRARVFMTTLRKNANTLTAKEYHELREMALDGDVEGASKQLEALLYTRG